MADRFVMGFDLGGTDLKAALVREDGGIARFSRRPSRTLESVLAPIEVIERVAADMRAAAPGDVVGAGVGCPGAIDPRNGSQVGRTAHLPHWDGFPLRAELERRLGLPVRADNDANLAALAEARIGAARGVKTAIVVTLGTGIGCGIVVNGEVLRGAWGGAGELGHLSLAKGETHCPCGVPGCVEPEASAEALIRAAHALGLEPAEPAALFASAARGEARAVAAVEAMADRLGATLAVAIHLLNPQIVVVGGGVAQAGDALLAPLGAAVERYTMVSHRKTLRIVPAALGERAGVTGAGLFGWQALGAVAVNA